MYITPAASSLRTLYWKTVCQAMGRSGPLVKKWTIRIHIFFVLDIYRFEHTVNKTTLTTKAITTSKNSLSDNGQNYCHFHYRYYFIKAWLKARRLGSKILLIALVQLCINSITAQFLDWQEPLLATVSKVFGIQMNLELYQIITLLVKKLHIIFYLYTAIKYGVVLNSSVSFKIFMQCPLQWCKLDALQSTFIKWSFTSMIQ